MVSLKGGRPLIGVLIRHLGWVGGRLSRSRCAMVVLFVRLCHRIHAAEGMKGLVLYLKTSYVLIQQAVAGYVIEDQSPLKRRVRRDKSGFPLWIPRTQRALLRRGDVKAVRFWTSLVSLYRILKFPSSPDFSSITDPGVDWLRNLVNQPIYHEGLQQAIQLFWNKVKINKSELKPLSFFPILKSSPVTSSLWYPLKGAISTSINSIKQSAFMVYHDQPLFNTMMIYAGEGAGFFEFFSNLRRSMATSDASLNDRLRPSNVLGRLGLKEEPAGKVRVFAMVDPWTQWLLFPLHKLLQEALRKITEDATFDQVKVMEDKLEVVAKKWKKGKAFSFDLSSATDRLPVGVQVSILTPLLGKYEAKAWASILIDRPYGLPKSQALKHGADSIKYTVGQPMGAYSSWVMLAVTHHVIVQWAAFMVGKTGWRRWFEDYVVLGDDIVIFDPLVAGCYFEIMTKILGVRIGLAKSIKSYNGLILEFAKKFWVRGKRAFVVPLRDSIVAFLSTQTLNEFMNKHQVSMNDYLRMRGLGYKSRSKYRAPFWSMPSRLRVIMVIRAYYEMPFFKWVTAISMEENFVISREGIDAFTLTTEKMLSRLIDRLESKKTPALQDYEKLLALSFYNSTDLLQEMEAMIKFGELINSSRFFPKPDLSLLSPEDQRTHIWDILDRIERLETAIEELPMSSFLTQVREDEKPFNSTLSIYSKWVEWNKCFVKAANVQQKAEDVTPDLVPDSPAWGTIEVSKFVPDAPYPWWYHGTVARDRIEWIFFYLLGALCAFLILDYNSLLNFGASPLDPDSSNKTDVSDDGGADGVDNSVGAGISVVDIWLAMMGGAFIVFFIAFLGTLSWDFGSLQELWNFLLECWSGFGVEEVRVPVETPTTFRFCTYAELVRWQELQQAPATFRSPQIGHGWSEPWSFNESWPENWR